MSERAFQSGGIAEIKPCIIGETPSDARVPCEVYSRIVGYLRPIQNWNAGKQQEFAERKPFRVPDANDLPAALPLLATPFEVKQ